MGVTAAAGASMLLGRAALAGDGPAITSDDGTFSRIKSAGSLKFGTSNDQPFAFFDNKTGKITGIDADMLLAMLEKLGIPGHSVLQVNFDGLIPGLLAGRMDMISDAMYITEKRKQVIDFSDGWYQYGETLLVKKGNPKNLHSLADLKGQTVGGQLGTVYLAWLNDVQGAKVMSYPTVSDMLRDLMIGRLSAGLLDAPVASYAMSQNPAYAEAFEMVGDYTPKETGVIGSGFRKDEGSLREAVNWALKAIKADGADLKVLQKWGLSEQNRHLLS